MLRGFMRKFKPFKILRDEQVEGIHRATLDVLRETGATFYHKRALKLFKENGCEVDFKKKRVRFPEALVEECIRKCPSSFRVKARNSNNDIILGGQTLYFVPSTGMHTVDLDTMDHRAATRKENYEGVTVWDAMGNIHYITPYCPYFGFEGAPSCMSILESVAAKFRNSSKVQCTGYSADCELFSIKMAKAIGVEMIGQILASPPLTYYEDAVEAMFRFVGEAGWPIQIDASPVTGGTGPATIAGSLVTGNAEVLAGLVLGQLIRPGARFIIVSFAFPMNMKTGAPGFGNITNSLYTAAFNQIWREYGIPTMTASGAFAGNSKRIDYQLGYEKAIPAIIGAISGASSVCMFGGLYGEITAHPVIGILEEDVAGMIGRFIEGIEVNDETLAIDLIEEVGPIPGYYLNKEHTRKWWKKEQFIPEVADRLSYPEWMKTDKKSSLDYAKEKMERILATYKVDLPLTNDQENAIEDILKEAREYYRKRGMISDEEWITYRKQIESPNYPYA